MVPQVPLLAELFRKGGFATGAFVSSVVLESQSGLDRGFDAYAYRFEVAGGDAQFLNTVQKKGEDTIAEAVEWLRGQPGRRVFLWLHLYVPHDPYEPPEPHASRYAGRPYDGEVAWSDELFGRFEDALGELGLRDDTALVVTSDHGEGLGEHDEALHGFFAYQTTLRVPFLVRAPGIPPGRRLERTLRLVDVFPTVLELAGIAPHPGLALSGRSLAAALRGGPEPEEPTTYAETLVPLLQFGWSDLRVVREGRFKYIQAPRPELYYLREDLRWRCTTALGPNSGTCARRRCWRRHGRTVTPGPCCSASASSSSSPSVPARARRCATSSLCRRSPGACRCSSATTQPTRTASSPCRRRAAVGVKVGPGPSGARCLLDDPAAVRDWLHAALEPLGPDEADAPVRVAAVSLGGIA